MNARTPWYGCVVAALSVVACSTAPSGAFDDVAIPESVTADRVIVHKDAHRLELYAGERLLKTYAIAIGSGGDGDKRFEGDRVTPEGRYTVDARHRSERFHRFLHISYPNAEDRERYERLREAGEVPDGAGVGSAIGVHGEKEGYAGWPHKVVDWTAGCIAVDNDEIEELYRVIGDGATIEIRP